MSTVRARHRASIESIHSLSCEVDLQSGKEKSVASGPSSPLRHLTFSPDRRFVLSTSFPDATPLRLWDWKTGKAVGKPFGSRGDIIAAFVPGQKVVSGRAAHDVFRVWDPVSGQETGRFGNQDSMADDLVSGKVLISETATPSFSACGR